MKTLKDFNFNNKRVLVRVNYDVPVDKKGNVTDSTKIEDSLPTIKYLLSKNAKIILMSHLGRPEGKIVDKLRMNRVAVRLSKLLNKKVLKLDDCIGLNVKRAVSGMKAKDIILLENLRFHKGEGADDLGFKKKLAALGDVYVNEAFSNSHRKHASMMLPELIPGCAGLSLEKELGFLSLDRAKNPIIVVIGGVKMETKLPVIKAMLKKADRVLVGGAMIYTFYRAQGYEIGKSLHEDSFLAEAKKLIKNKNLVLPVDTIVSDKKDVAADKIPKGKAGMDIGPESVKLFKKEMMNAGTLIWNGPPGKFEETDFSAGTRGVAKAIAESRAVKIAGGGDTMAAIKKFRLERRFDHISTGGGAMLEFLSGKDMPALTALDK